MSVPDKSMIFRFLKLVFSAFVSRASDFRASVVRPFVSRASDSRASDFRPFVSRAFVSRASVFGLFLFGLSIAAPVSRPVFAQGIVDRDHVPSLERVDPFERRRDNIDGNNLRVSITNYGQTAQTGSPGDFWYEWPKNTGRRYVALTQFWVGGRVEDSVGDTLWVVDVPSFRNNPVNENISWTFEPIKGYVNPGGESFGIAQSDDPASWPSSWPDKVTDTVDPGWSGSWNGFFGKNVFNADQEFFFKIGDDQYDRFGSYFPDSTDFSRKGMALVAETRMLAWSQILIDDVIFTIHGVKNDGTGKILQTGFSMWLADLVGGDASDDIPFFDLLEDVAFMTDADGIGDEFFGTDPVGVATFSFLETPGNAIDRIDNDGDGSTIEDCDPFISECNSPVVPESFLVGEKPTNGIDDNGNGLIDENRTHTVFSGEQLQNVGVGYADYIDNDSDGEMNGPVVTLEMRAQATAGIYGHWPPAPGSDAISTGLDGRPIVHLIGVDDSDVGLSFKDGIDNDDSHVQPTPNYPFLSEPGSPLVTQDMIDQAAGDAYGRYRVPGTNIILHQVGPEDLGKAYADGIDNDQDGAIDEGIDEGIDEMIDESRSDGIDNDRDWNVLQNDTGLDGVPFTGDAGDGDGVPTTGSGTTFPGERNIDITDISESDQIGITNVQIIPAFFLNLNSNSDRFLFNTFMIPGLFDEDIPEPGENDIVISSGLFPLLAGQTERISVAVILGQTIEDALQSRDFALQAYLEDYQFAQAPITPKVSAVAGDGYVTLYWDSASEESFDQFLAGLGRDPFDFEGYRIYRSTDAAFLDPLTITDGFGNLLIREPIAQFDLIDGHEGFHPTDINGVKFFLGTNRVDEGEDDSGLTHKFIDTDVINGITYFYAVTAYDFGSAIDNIPPTETAIRIQRMADGTIETGPNVVEVVATQAVAGFTDAKIEDLKLTKGATSSTIGWGILDATVVKDDHRYRVVFEDTLKVGTRNAPDTLTTKNFSLIDLTLSDTVIVRSEAFKQGSEFPIFDRHDFPLGFNLLFIQEPFIILNKAVSSWSSDLVYPISLEPYNAIGFVKGLRNPFDYRVDVVGPSGGQSIELQITRSITLPSRPTNVRVFRILPDGSELEIPYAFGDLTGPDFISPISPEPATFSADPSIGETDLIILFEPGVGDPDMIPVITWQIGLNFVFADRSDPVEGDIATIVTKKPFLASDEFEFVVKGPGSDAEQAKAGLDNIKVVPNPYVAANTFEKLNPFSSGRGERMIKFIHLPPRATIRIFTVSGAFVRQLHHFEGSNDSLPPEAFLDGTVSWDLLSFDGLTVAYGIYVYHVRAEGIGEKTGTFAIIK